MWPVDLYISIGEPGPNSVAALSAFNGGLEGYRSLEPFVRGGIQFAGALLGTMIVLGLLQNYGRTTVKKSRHSPVISVCLGLPSLLVVAGLAGAGYLIVDTSIGAFFGIPLVILGVTVLPVAISIGLTTIGRTFASRLGTDRLWAGIVVGAVLSGLVGLALPATLVLAGIAGSLGLGASVRVLFDGAGAGRPDERTVPPANKI